MSRSGYTDEIVNEWEFICYRGAVNSAIRGKRGQQLLTEMAEALDAMPVKELIADKLEHQGQYCALGTVGVKRNIDMSEIDSYDQDSVSEAFNIAPSLAAEIAFINDEAKLYAEETPAQRWVRVRAWVERNIKKPVIKT